MADKDMKWKTLSQKYLIEKPWLTARVDKVELPTGAIIDEYYVLEYPDWVNTIAITKDGMFVFVRQYRYAIGKTVNELCAGVIEKGEDPMAAARRELMEETGFGGGNWQKWMTISANPSLIPILPIAIWLRMWSAWMFSILTRLRISRFASSPGMK